VIFKIANGKWQINLIKKMQPRAKKLGAVFKWQNAKNSLLTFYIYIYNEV
jgi:hypothetical protein